MNLKYEQTHQSHVLAMVVKPPLILITFHKRNVLVLKFTPKKWLALHWMIILKFSKSHNYSKHTPQRKDVSLLLPSSFKQCKRLQQQQQHQHHPPCHFLPHSHCLALTLSSSIYQLVMFPCSFCFIHSFAIFHYHPNKLLVQLSCSQKMLVENVPFFLTLVNVYSKNAFTTCKHWNQSTIFVHTRYIHSLARLHTYTHSRTHA